jgi:hypothetical protein
MTSGKGIAGLTEQQPFRGIPSFGIGTRHLIPIPMDKKGHLLRPEDGSHSSSSSGAENTRTRYKPLAPRQLSGKPMYTLSVVRNDKVDSQIWYQVF